jgi:cob(I)alamin adenosyltransferase
MILFNYKYMKIYTKTGDDGTTGLFNGERVRKDNLRISSYGTIDELNTIIGIAISFEKSERLSNDLTIISNMLFRLGTDLATPLNPEPKFPIKRITEDEVIFLENLIDDYNNELPPLKQFILPGGVHSAAFLQQARTVARRAERSIVSLESEIDIGPFIVKFVNRLSDYLFTAARLSNKLSGQADIIANF